MYNLLEHSQNYFMTSVSLRDYYRDEVWRSLDLPLINCEIELHLKWTRNCVLIEKDDSITKLTITSTKLYVPVVTLSINDNIKFLENIKQGFKRTISCNKYRSEITTQPKKDNLDYLIDPTFRNISRLFVLSFKNGYNEPTRNSFDRYYIPLVEIKYFNVLIDNKPSFDQLLKNKPEAYEKLIKMSWSNNYITGNLLDFSYNQIYNTLIVIDLSGQTNMSIPHKINLVGKLEEDDSEAMFLLLKRRKNILFFKFVSCFRTT